jgi:hypothetical protein
MSYFSFVPFSSPSLPFASELRVHDIEKTRIVLVDFACFSFPSFSSSNIPCHFAQESQSCVGEKLCRVKWLASSDRTVILPGEVRCCSSMTVLIYFSTHLTVYQEMTMRELGGGFVYNLLFVDMYLIACVYV